MRSPGRYPIVPNQILDAPLISNGFTLVGGGTISSTINGDIALSPHGTGEVTGVGALDKSKIITFDTSLYVRTIPIPIWSCFPAAGTPPTKVGVTGGSLGGYLMDDTAEVLSYKSHIFSDWDGESDPWIEVVGECGKDNTGGSDTDVVNLTCTIRHKRNGELVWKYCIVTTQLVFGKADLYEQSTGDMILDHDKVDHLLVADSAVGIGFFNQISTSDINEFILTGLTLKYLTREINPVAP